MTFEEWLKTNEKQLDKRLYEIMEAVGLNICESKQIAEVLEKAWKDGFGEGARWERAINDTIEDLKRGSS